MNKIKMEEYDLIIIGAGPAGLTAGVYAGRYLLKTLIIGKLPGGMISEAHKVCNFPSYKTISGMELTKKMVEQVKELGIEVKSEEVKEIKTNEVFEIKTDNLTYKTKKIILAVGRKRKKLNILGEKEFLGKGVSYCATCDAGFFKDKDVAIVGGSNTALTAALLLAEYAKKVYIIYRKGSFFRAEPAWIKQVEKNKKIKTIFNANVQEIYGKERVEKVKLDNKSDLKVDGIFVEIGSIPDEKFSKQLGLKTEKKYIKVNKKQETNIKGIFAAGDVTDNLLKQAVTACGEGAIAATSAYEEIKGGEN